MDLLRSLPIGLYLEHPITWLHHLDPRVKLGWLMSFLLAPLLGDPLWRIALVVLLIAITLAARIPLRVWRSQMGLLIVFCTTVLFISAIAPDGFPVSHQPRLPQDELAFSERSQLPPPPQRNPWYNPLGIGTQSSQPSNDTPPSLTDLPQPTRYRYVLFDRGPLTVTRRSLELGIRVSTLLFTLIYSTNLYLLTTAPEEITAGLEDLMQPLRRFGVPVTELTLTLTLSLRFIPLVLEEIQNLSRSIQTRAINWKKLGFRGTVKVWTIVSDRLLENLLMRAEQIATAMQIRGFTSASTHRVEWHQLRLNKGDWVVLALLVVFWGVGIYWNWYSNLA